jgi:alkylated DNA nucleotide flippase Atl1
MPTWVYVFTFGIAVGALAYRDIAKAVGDYRENRVLRRTASRNTPQQNLRMIRACIREMRRCYRTYPADRFVEEMLTFCDRVELEITQQLEVEEAAYVAHAR